MNQDTRDTGAEQDGAAAQTEPGELLQRRRNARRTALFLGIVAFVVFMTFIATGVIGRSGT